MFLQKDKCREFFTSGNYSGPLAEMCRDLRRRSIIKSRDIKTDDDNMEELYLEAGMLKKIFDAIEEASPTSKFFK